MEAIDNPKLQQIYSTARSLFWKFGLKRVSVEEICREAGVSKMTFYKHFKNKSELFIAVYNKVAEEALGKYHQIMNQNIPFTDKVKQTIQLKMEQTNEVSRELLDDLFKNGDTEIINYFVLKRNETIQMILNDYIKAQKNGDIRQDINPKFILYFLNHMFDMAADEKLIALYENTQDLIMELTSFFFYGIIPPQKETQDGI